MTPLHTAARMALDALESALSDDQPYIERCKAAITALREALAQPAPEPIGEVLISTDPLGREGVQVVKWADNAPATKVGMKLYAAPPAAPAPVVPEGDVVVSWNEDGQIVAVTRQDEEGRILSVIAESAAHAAPVVREPVIDEMDAVASKYAHKMALDLECVLSDYSGKWWDAAMQTLGEYRSAMNAIHERESPTHMGEPVLPQHGITGGGNG